MADVSSITLSNGQAMPALGLGTWLSDKGKVAEAVKVALACGYRHVDCAWAYRNEAEVGEGIKAKIDDGTIKREDIFITTKLWSTHHRPDLVESACKESLANLGLTYADLYLMHWPFALRTDDEGGPVDGDGKFVDGDVDYLDAWKAMEALVDKGLVKSIGISNFNCDQLHRLLNMTGLKHRPTVQQIESHPYFPNNKLISLCKQNGIAITAYCPLGNISHPSAKEDHPNIFNDPVVTTIGKKYGKTSAQVALRWGLQRGCIVIPKSITPSRIKENIQVTDFSLSEEDMEKISALDRNYRVGWFLMVKDVKHYPFIVEN